MCIMHMFCAYLCIHIINETLSVKHIYLISLILILLFIRIEYFIILKYKIYQNKHK